MFACLDTWSKTDLYPQLPPMLFQVRGFEAVLGSGGVVQSSQRVFSYGTNPNASPTDTPDPTTLTMAAVEQAPGFRLIMSDLLLGNYLEDVECRDGSFSFVPVTATPDDVAKCATSQSVLPLLCTGVNAMCICQNGSGCLAAQLAGAPVLVPKGQPVGVLDTNQDGAPDVEDFIEGSVEMICTGTATGSAHNVPVNLSASYWSPSGDQQEPAAGIPTPFDELGPAIVVQPQDFGTDPNIVHAILPSSSKCNFKFDPSVVDKKGERPCAPVGGFGGSNVSAFDLSCTPGDTSAADFITEPLFINVSANGVALTQGLKIMRTSAIALDSSDGIPMDANSLLNVQLFEGSAVYTQIMPTLNGVQSELDLIPTAAAGLDPNATYTLVIPGGSDTNPVTDTFGEPNVQSLSITFTTGP
jgi:hypothetical protein